MEICSICGHGFNKKANFSRHLLLHKTENDFSCSQCSAKFKAKRYLRNHMKIHEENDVFSCTQCDKSFTKKATLKRHTKEVHSDKIDKCSQCLKIFSRALYLKKHIESCQSNDDKQDDKAMQLERHETCNFCFNVFSSKDVKMWILVWKISCPFPIKISNKKDGGNEFGNAKIYQGWAWNGE